MTALTDLIKQYVNTATTATKGTTVFQRYLVPVCDASLVKKKGVLRLYLTILNKMGVIVIILIHPSIHPFFFLNQH